MRSWLSFFWGRGFFKEFWQNVWLWFYHEGGPHRMWTMQTSMYLRGRISQSSISHQTNSTSTTTTTNRQTCRKQEWPGPSLPPEHPNGTLPAVPDLTALRSTGVWSGWAPWLLWCRPLSASAMWPAAARPGYRGTGQTKTAGWTTTSLTQLKNEAKHPFLSILITYIPTQQ